MNDETIIRLRNINAKLDTLNKILEPPLTTAITDIQEDIQEIINNEEIEDKERMDKIIEEIHLPNEPYNDNRIVDALFDDMITALLKKY